jgi:hypothetical protein
MACIGVAVLTIKMTKSATPKEIPNGVADWYALDSYREGSPIYWWSSGRKRGWLILNARNWERLKTGDLAILMVSVPFIENERILHRIRELLVKITKIEGERRDRVEFLAPDLNVYSTAGYNIVAKKLEEGGQKG